MSITADMKNISMPFLAAVIIRIIESLHSQIIKANKTILKSGQFCKKIPIIFPPVKLHYK